MIGQKVKLTKSMAKWTLEHPDAYCTPFGVLDGVPDVDFDLYMQMSILTLLNGDITGKVVRQGAEKNVWGVEFKTPFGKDMSYYEYPEHIVKTK